MIRTRTILALLALLAMLPLTGCAGRRLCCNSSSYAERPVTYAQPAPCPCQ